MRCACWPPTETSRSEQGMRGFMANALSVGVCGIGLDAYWSQFAGLQARLEGYLREAETRLERAGAVVEYLGLVDTPQRGREAGHACRRADIDLLVIYITT